jgi:hypothetical protein
MSRALQIPSIKGVAIGCLQYSCLNSQILPQRNRLRPDEIGFAFHWAGISQGRQIAMNVRWRL